MRITVRVQPRAKKEEVVHEGDNRYRVKVSAPPVEGRANERVIELLAVYFNTAKRNIVLVRGETGREKSFEVHTPG